ncbi:MAG: BatD family protein [Pirellulales bacterium]
MRCEIFQKSVAWLLLAVAMSGCAPSAESRSPASNSTSKTAKQTNGNVELTALIEPDNIQLSEDVRLTLSVRKPVNTRIEFPNLAGQLEDFTVAGTQDALPIVDGEMQVVRRDYQLQPKRPGDISLELPPVYFSNFEDDSTEKSFVEVSPINLKVVSEAADGNISIETVRKPSAPIELPTSEVRRLAIWIALAILAVGITLLAVVITLLKKRNRKAIQLTPRETALRALQRLIDSQLSRTDSKQYYVELTALVRRYIEGCTAIRAPELTTEEFLREVSSTENFPAELKLNLKAFLESADLVKFAGQHPSEQELAGSAQRAREFVDTQWPSGGASA